MKKALISALAAFGLALGASAAGELVATGADVRAWRLGEVGGGALTDASVGVRRTVCPWRLYVTNAVLSLAGLAAPWEVVSTNGVTSTATNHTTAAARARNEERRAAKNAALTAPLRERIAELEALLDEAVKRGDALAAALEEEAARARTPLPPPAASERAGKDATASAPAKRKGK